MKASRERAQKEEKEFWVNLIQEGYFGIKGQDLMMYLRALPLLELPLYGFDLIDFGNKFVLEIGCGPYGYVTVVNAKYKIGIDPLMNFYNKKYKLVDGPDYLKGLGEFIPLPKECVDVIFCRNVLDHVYDPRLVILEMNRVLKMGGLLIFQMNTYDFILAFLRKHVRTTRRLWRAIFRSDCPIQIDLLHPHNYTTRGISHLMKSYGFEILRGWERAPLKGGVKTKYHVLIRAVLRTLPKIGVRDFRAVFLKKGNLTPIDRSIPWVN